MAGDLLDGEPRSGFQDLLDYNLVEWAQGHAVLELHIDRRHSNRAGAVHGGVLATLIDTACGFAATWCPAPGRVRRVATVSLTIGFAGQAHHGLVRAVGRLRAGGRRIVFCSAEVLDAQGRLVAMGEGSFRYRSGSESPEGVPL